MVGTVEDHEEIRQLMARYCQLLDTQDAAGWASLFSEDGVLDLGGTRTQGTEALQAYVHGLRAAHQNSPIRHLVTNVVINVDGDDATSQSYVVLLNPGAPTPIGMTGTYDDRLRRIDGRWRLVQRHLVPDFFSSGVRAVLRQLPGMGYRAAKIRYRRALQSIRTEPARS
jgi:uncharacterized protein (TIGR02246 family)